MSAGADNISRDELREQYERASTLGIIQGPQLADLVAQARRGELSPFETAYLTATVLGGKVNLGLPLTAAQESFVRSLREDDEQ